MAVAIRPFLILLTVLATRALGQCTSYGVDYANGGEYNIDSTSNDYFSFVTIFTGCTDEELFPVLVDPSDNRYTCSGIPTNLEGEEVTSTCGIPFSAMRSGEWRILLAGDEVQVQRTITLTVGEPEVETVTATPTIVLGITSTPSAVTVESTIEQTVSLILVPSTVTAPCGADETQTITDFQAATTVVVETTATRTSTEGQVTSYWETTETTQAACHYPTKKRNLQDREEAVVAATTVTITQTTYTVTQTDVTTLPAETTTEVAFETTTTTIDPPPTTVCQGGEAVVVTVNPNEEAVTQTNLVYETSHLSGTVWVGQTEYMTATDEASATACWRAGGWYGR